MHLKDIHRRILCGFAGLLIAGMLGSTAQAQPKFYPRIEILAAGGVNFPLNQFNENADVGVPCQLAGRLACWPWIDTRTFDDARQA